MTTTEAIPKLLRYDDVADALGVTERTVRTLCRSGGLAFVRVGQSVRFKPDDVAAYIERQRQGGEA